MTFRTFTLEKALEKLAEAGFDKVELCTVGDWVPHFDIANATDKSIIDCAGTFRRTGMKAVSLNISGDFTVNQLENGYALAKELGAVVVTYCCGNPKPDTRRSEQLKERAEFNSKLADLGDKYGLICSIEAPHKKSLAEKRSEIDEYWSMQDEPLPVFDGYRILRSSSSRTQNCHNCDVFVFRGMADKSHKQVRTNITVGDEPDSS